MNIEELTQLVVNALEDVKAKDIKVFNTEGLTAQIYGIGTVDDCCFQHIQAACRD